MPEGRQSGLLLAATQSTTIPGLPRVPGAARNFRPIGVARLCGSGSPDARFTAPRAPRARGSRGAPAGRYATEAA